MKYILIVKGNNEAIDRVTSDSYDMAYNFFVGRKQMDKITFNKLYEVKVDEK